MYSAYTASHQHPSNDREKSRPYNTLPAACQHYMPYIFAVLPESHYGTNIGNWLKFRHVVSVEPLAIRYNTLILELLPQSHEARPHFAKIWTYLNAK